MEAETSTARAACNELLGDDENDYMFVDNASNRVKILHQSKFFLDRDLIVVQVRFSEYM